MNPGSQAGNSKRLNRHEKDPTMRFGFVMISLLSAISFAHAGTITVGGTPLVNQGQVTSVAGATTVNFNALSNGGPQNFVSGIASYSNLFVRSGLTTDITGDTSPFVNPLSTTGDITVNFSKPIVYFGLYWGSPARSTLSRSSMAPHRY
jgi:hypothetical protein